MRSQFAVGTRDFDVHQMHRERLDRSAASLLSEDAGASAPAVTKEIENENTA